MLVASPPAESARLAIYWVDDRWRWPLLLVTGVVGLSGLARLARRGQSCPRSGSPAASRSAFSGRSASRSPSGIGSSSCARSRSPSASRAVVAGGRRETKTIGIVAATVVVALGIKAGTLIEAPPTVSYFGQSLQPVWELGHHIPPAPGLVATDPATAYFIPATTGRRVLTVDKGHVSSRDELATAPQRVRTAATASTLVATTGGPRHRRCGAGTSATPSSRSRRRSTRSASRFHLADRATSHRGATQGARELLLREQPHRDAHLRLARLRGLPARPSKLFPANGGQP